MRYSHPDLGIERGWYDRPRPRKHGPDRLVVSGSFRMLLFLLPAGSLAEYDVVLELENDLMVHLTSRHTVDGHDSGAGESNVFIHTDNPEELFLVIQDVLEMRDLLSFARVAYRSMASSVYKILWPGVLKTFRVK